jgi:hypothetical protein
MRALDRHNALGGRIDVATPVACWARIGAGAAPVDLEQSAAVHAVNRAAAGADSEGAAQSPTV